MYSATTKVRVRYGETDRMGYTYYGNYAQYYEIGRTDLMRQFGLTYRSFEDSGIILPVLTLNIKYIKPSYYDDLLTIKTTINNLPGIRIKFDYEIFNEQNELINIGDTTLVFVDEKTRNPRKPPEKFLKEIKKYFP
ncbi:MAG: acyl-CoA thioesterase [Chlorobi bacterium]|nr:acyl-CoA thioesterase [Chlorobiota bacterium]